MKRLFYNCHRYSATIQVYNHFLRVFFVSGTQRKNKFFKTYVRQNAQNVTCSYEQEKTFMKLFPQLLASRLNPPPRIKSPLERERKFPPPSFLPSSLPSSSSSSPHLPNLQPKSFFFSSSSSFQIARGLIRVLSWHTRMHDV